MKHPAARIVFGIFPAIAAALFGGCLQTGGGGTSEVPTSTVGTGDATLAARSAQVAGGGRQMGMGGGASMEPLYSEGTMLVTEPIPWEDLEPGMNVAYFNRRGDRVVHQLLRRRGAGWVAKGVGNQNIDAELVTQENIIGVVYGVFYTDE